LREVDLVAEMAVYNPFDFFLEPEAEKFPFVYADILDHELEPFRRKATPTPEFTEYFKKVSNEIFGVGRFPWAMRDRARSISWSA